MMAWIANALEELLDFSRVLNASIAASWLVLVVLTLRLALKRAPKWIHVALWGLVALRLALPVPIESALSLLPSAETVPQAMLQSQGDQLFQPAHLALVSNPLYAGSVTLELDRTVGGLQVDMTLLTPIWLAGTALLLLYAAVSYGRLRRRVRTAVPYGDGAYQSEQVRSPFVMGLLRPRIYLPFGMPRQELGYVLAHERAHIRRKDHWWKPLGFLLLAVHWFNPLLWLAYGQLCRDIELACDERVIRDLDNGQKADYTQTLLACSVGRRLVAPCPLAFGEVGVKERVRAVMQYKKPAFWLVALALAACVAAAVFFLTTPPARQTPAGQQAEPTGQTGPAAASGGADEAEPLPLTRETAADCIAQVLGSLTVHSDETVSFSLPASIPAAQDDLTRLVITLNATYATDPGTYRVDHLLEDETFWQGGETFQRALDGEGEPVGLMLRVAFMTQVAENAYQEYAANYLELSAPFTYDTPAGFTEPAVVIGQDDELAYSLKTGAVTVRISLPEGCSWQMAEQQAGYEAPALLLTKDGETVGSLVLIGLGTTDRQALETVDTGADELPMPVFSPVALSNHAGYEDYQVRNAWATGAAATARYVWQDLSESEGNAASLPWQEMDCVLAYDWEVTDCFVQLLTDTGALTEAERAALAEGLTIAAD